MARTTERCGTHPPGRTKPRPRPRGSMVRTQPFRCVFGRSPGLGVSPANAGCSSARSFPIGCYHRSVAYVRALFPPHRRGAAPDFNRIPFFRHKHYMLCPWTEATTVCRRWYRKVNASFARPNFEYCSCTIARTFHSGKDEQFWVWIQQRLCYGLWW